MAGIDDQGVVHGGRVRDAKAACIVGQRGHGVDRHDAPRQRAMGFEIENRSDDRVRPAVDGIIDRPRIRRRRADAIVGRDSQRRESPETLHLVPSPNRRPSCGRKEHRIRAAGS